MVDGPLVIADGEPVEAALRDTVAAGYDVVVTTGGTGLTPATHAGDDEARVAREIPGIGEALRRRVPRPGCRPRSCRAGRRVADRTLIVNLPGSTGGVRDGMAVLALRAPGMPCRRSTGVTTSEQTTDAKRF